MPQRACVGPIAGVHHNSFGRAWASVVGLLIGCCFLCMRPFALEGGVRCALRPRVGVRFARMLRRRRSSPCSPPHRAASRSYISHGARTSREAATYADREMALDVAGPTGYYSQTRLARSMGSGDDMFRTWSGPEGSSHKEPLPGTRSHRAHGAFLCGAASWRPRASGPGTPARPLAALADRPRHPSAFEPCGPVRAFATGARAVARLRPRCACMLAADARHGLGARRWARTHRAPAAPPPAVPSLGLTLRCQKS